jgi:flagellar protein FlaJ
LNVRDLCYAHFSWLGNSLSKVFKGAEKDLDAAYMKVHPDVYFSIVGFGALITLLIPATLIVLWFSGFWPVISFLPANGFIIIPLSALVPAVVILFGILVPKTAASNRISGLKTEIPYASMYISVMASGGLSPYESLLRMRSMDLLPNMQKEVSRIETIVMSTGADPVTAMETAAKEVSITEYKELLLGYASTVRTGGDTLHYLFNQTDGMFRSLSSRVKAMGENMGMLMETYTIVGILGVLGIFLIFVIGTSLPQAGVSFTPFQFFAFSFAFMPFLSVVFLYAGDAGQMSYPVSNWKTYRYFVALAPIGILAGSQLVLPFFDKSLLLFPPAYDFIIFIRQFLGFAEGTEAAIGLALTLVIIGVPGVLADYLFIGRDRSIHNGIIQFLRDLVETRKSGLNPERCINALSGRDYKAFTKHLETINLKINWGYPIRQIYGEFKSNVKNWLALVNIYLLIDTLEVGGGSIASLETLANFAESSKRLEDEKRSLLMPLMIVPYIGAALLTGTTVMFLSFFVSMSSMGVSVPSVELYRTLLTPLALHSFMLGLVTGKITSGRVSAGFKHAIFLTLIALGGIWAVARMGTGGFFIG